MLRRRADDEGALQRVIRMFLKCVDLMCANLILLGVWHQSHGTKLTTNLDEMNSNDCDVGGRLRTPEVGSYRYYHRLPSMPYYYNRNPVIGHTYMPPNAHPVVSRPTPLQYEAEHSAWRVAHAEELEAHDAEHTNGPIL